VPRFETPLTFVQELREEFWGLLALFPPPTGPSVGTSQGSANRGFPFSGTPPDPHEFSFLTTFKVGDHFFFFFLEWVFWSFFFDDCGEFPFLPAALAPPPGHRGTGNETWPPAAVHWFLGRIVRVTPFPRS